MAKIPGMRQWSRRGLIEAVSPRGQCPHITKTLNKVITKPDDSVRGVTVGGARTHRQAANGVKK